MLFDPLQPGSDAYNHYHATDSTVPTIIITCCMIKNLLITFKGKAQEAAAVDREDHIA